MVVAITYGTPYLQAGEYSGSQGPGAKVLSTIVKRGGTSGMAEAFRYNTLPKLLISTLVVLTGKG